MIKKHLTSTSTFSQMIRFGLVGLSNTAVTALTITLFSLFLPAYYVVGNGLGYLLGVINSFIWNKKFTFRSGEAWLGEAVKFLLVFLLCYALQFLVTTLLIRQFQWGILIPQLLGMIVYNLNNFFLNKIFTFKEKGEE